jgi:hypothetical protein
LLDILFAGPNRNIRGGKVALVEGSNLVLGEGPDDTVQNASVVEKDQILLTPIMRVDKLPRTMVNDSYFIYTCGRIYIWRDGRSLHLVNNISHLFQVLEMRTIGIESPFALGTSG